MRFLVKILGSGGAIPAHNRFPSAQMVMVRNHFLLLDCGEGTQMQIKKLSTGPQRISHIFISHLHGDHYNGLIGLISSYHLLARKLPLYVYGPPGLKSIIDLQLKLSETVLVYPLVIQEINPAKTKVIVDTDYFTVKTIPMDHRIPTCGFLIREKPLKRNISKEFVSKVKIPYDSYDKIRDGEDYIDEQGKVYPNHEITTDPPPVRSYAYCTDTAYFEPVVNIIRGVSALYHEATFADDKLKDAKEKGHATARQAANIARNAGVGRLIIGHFSSRYKEPDILLHQARQIFPDTISAEDGMIIEL